MTITNIDFFDLASLTEASYAQFDIFNVARDAIINSGLSPSQTDALLVDWQVITAGHQPNTSSGFFSTLFQNKHDNSYVLAFRGTEILAQGGADVGADVGDIISDGLAIEQIIDLHNEWARIISPGVYSAAKLDVLGAETAS